MFNVNIWDFQNFFTTGASVMACNFNESDDADADFKEYDDKTGDTDDKYDTGYIGDKDDIDDNCVKYNL